MDHLIYTLVSDVILYYVTCSHSQNLGFKGPDLAEKRHKEIRLQAGEMNAVQIHNLCSNCFSMESATDSTWRYLVDLGNKSCDCPDWPWVWLCKHISAVEHYFGNNDQRMGASEDVLPKMPLPNQDAVPDTHGNAGATTASILQNMISVSRGTLDDGVPSSTETVQSLRAIEAHLTAVVRSTRSTESPVLDKEEVLPNQWGSMWAETAKCMGAKQRRKRAQADTEASKPPATA